LYRWDTYRIEIQKDTDAILKILLSRDTKYRFVFLSIFIVSNRKIHIVNRKMLTSTMEFHCRRFLQHVLLEIVETTLLNDSLSVAVFSIYSVFSRPINSFI
jgi:hypothetical protein